MLYDIWERRVIQYLIKIYYCLKRKNIMKTWKKWRWKKIKKFINQVGTSAHSCHLSQTFLPSKLESDATASTQCFFILST